MPRRRGIANATVFARCASTPRSAGRPQSQIFAQKMKKRRSGQFPKFQSVSACTSGDAQTTSGKPTTVRAGIVRIVASPMMPGSCAGSVRGTQQPNIAPASPTDAIVRIEARTDRPYTTGADLPNVVITATGVPAPIARTAPVLSARQQVHRNGLHMTDRGNAEDLMPQTTQTFSVPKIGLAYLAYSSGLSNIRLKRMPEDP